MKITVRLITYKLHYLTTSLRGVCAQNVETGHRVDLRKIKVTSSRLISITNDSKNPQIITTVFFQGQSVQQAEKAGKAEKRHVLKTLAEKAEKQCFSCGPGLKKLNFIF